MGQRTNLVPSFEDLQAYCLGLLCVSRAAEVEAFLIDGPDCSGIMAAATDDAVAQHLRGIGGLPAQDRGPAEPVADNDAQASALRDQPRYQIIRKLGQGGMGAVYLAEHRLMHRLVAIKLIRLGRLASPQFARRFRQEIKAVAKLSHPNIVAAHDADECNGAPFLVMEYVQGESLAQLVERHGPLPMAEACAYIRQAALGLEFAHVNGLVHRDIKPHNLMLAQDGTVKILDFGLARLRAEEEPGESAERRVHDTDTPQATRLSLSGTVLGTTDYLAPEQAVDSRRADIRADIYSLGCTLYHLVTGQVPFPGSDAREKIRKHANAPVELTALTPIAAVLAKMMAKSPTHRYQTPAEVADALAPFVGKSRPRPRSVVLFAVAAAVLVAGAIWALAYTARTENPLPNMDIAKSGPSEPTALQIVQRFPYPGQIGMKTVFSLDGRCLAGIADNGFRVWEIDTGKVVASGDRLQRMTFGVFSPEGNLLTAHTDGTFNEWDVKTGKAVQTITGPAGYYRISSFSPNGASFAAVGAGAEAQVWDIKKGKIRFTVKAEQAGPNLMHNAPLSPDGSWLQTFDYSGAEGVLRIFDAATGVQALRVPLKMGLHTTAWSADSRQIYANANDPTEALVVCFDARTGAILSRVSLPPQPAAPHGRKFSHDGRFLVMLFPDDNFLQLFDARTGKLLSTFSTPNSGFSESFSPDDRYFACGGPNEALLFRVPDLPAEAPR